MSRCVYCGWPTRNPAGRYGATDVCAHHADLARIERIMYRKTTAAAPVDPHQDTGAAADKEEH